MSDLIQQKSFTVSSAGSNTVLTPRDSKGRLMIFSVIYNPNADITGEIQILVGSDIKSGARNAKTGAIYGFNHHPNFILGGVGESLKVWLPSGTATTVDVAWKEAPAFSRET